MAIEGPQTGDIRATLESARKRQEPEVAARLIYQAGGALLCLYARAFAMVRRFACEDRVIWAPTVALRVILFSPFLLRPLNSLAASQIILPGRAMRQSSCQSHLHRSRFLIIQTRRLSQPLHLLPVMRLRASRAITLIMLPQHKVPDSNLHSSIKPRLP